MYKRVMLLPSNPFVSPSATCCVVVTCCSSNSRLRALVRLALARHWQSGSSVLALAFCVLICVPRVLKGFWCLAFQGLDLSVEMASRT